MSRTRRIPITSMSWKNGVKRIVDVGQPAVDPTQPTKKATKIFFI